MNSFFSVLGSVCANFGALMIGFVIGQFLVCSATSFQRPKALLNLFVGPIVLAPWFALFSVVGAVLCAGSIDAAGLCLVVFGLLGGCFAIGGDNGRS